MGFSTFGDSPLDEIYVLDTETTGLDGAPKDCVVDIGITKVSLTNGIVKDMYSEVVGHDVARWDESRRHSWIFENTDMTVEMVGEGKPEKTVIREVSELLKGKFVTAYNTGYDFGKFLYLEPWNLHMKFVECYDIMKAATPICKVPSKMFEGKYSYPKLDLAYKTIVEGDPAGINGVQNHRALSDAQMASYVMIQMFKDGKYSP